MLENFEKAKGSLTAEPLYVLLARYGHANAHEAARRVSLKAAESNSTVLAEAMKAEQLRPFIAEFSKSERKLLENPALYTGIAAKKPQKFALTGRKHSGFEGCFG